VAQRVARPAQTRLQNLGGTGPKFTKFFIRRTYIHTYILKCIRGVIGGVKTRIHVVILPSVVERQRTERRRGIYSSLFTINGSTDREKKKATA